MLGSVNLTRIVAVSTVAMGLLMGCKEQGYSLRTGNAELDEAFKTPTKDPNQPETSNPDQDGSNQNQGSNPNQPDSNSNQDQQNNGNNNNDQNGNNNGGNNGDNNNNNGNNGDDNSGNNPGHQEEQGGNQQPAPQPTPPQPEPPKTRETYNLDYLYDNRIPKTKIDILVVVDNSQSMNFEQKNMATRMKSLLKEIDGLDWRLAMTTTDIFSAQQGRKGSLLPLNTKSLQVPASLNRYYLQSSDSSDVVEKVFAQTVQRPASEGSSAEQGIAATSMFLDRWVAGAADVSSFVRSEAKLHVIVITDADESPLRVDMPNNKPLNLLNQVKSSFKNEKTFVFHSIIVKPDDVACLNNKTFINEAYGLRYVVLSKKTGGLIGSVCEPDYGVQLKALGVQVRESINAITLNCDPVDNHVEALDESGRALAIESLQGRKLTFKQGLPNGQIRLKVVCEKEEN